MSRKKIVVMGGGTGTFTVLSGLRHHPVDLSAIVSVADNGGSTGILRDELGVLPPGDIRQCLVALSAGDVTLRNLFNYRFHEGSLTGQNFGNLFLSALEKITGDPLSAVREAHRILNVEGRVIPVSPIASNLFAEFVDGTIIAGEHSIDKLNVQHGGIRRCFLSPTAPPNPDAVQSILDADLVVLSPGDVFTSLMPVLLVEGIRDALASTSAKRAYVVNLVTKKGQTDGFSAKTFCDVIASAISPATLDAVVVNSTKPSESLLEKYEITGDHVVSDDLDGTSFNAIRASLLAEAPVDRVAGDRLERSLLRHDPAKLAVILLTL